MASSVLTVGEYLIERLYSHGVHHIFGVPGDYVLGFFKQLCDSPIKVINTCDEQGAGFAADAYARVRGLGAVCVTYCVGGLKVANTTAQAYAEKSPVVVISGAPGTNERHKNPLLHHKVREFDTQLKVFEQLTVAATVLDDPQTAFCEIDRVFEAALRYRRPVYIELPRNVARATGSACHLRELPQETSDPATLGEAVKEAVARINASRQPVILAGEELHRFALQPLLAQLIEKTNIPVASTILGKSVFPESHPRYLGVYEGAMGREDVRDYVEASDCLVLLGALMTDMNLGIYTANLDPRRSIYCATEKLTIGYHSYEDVRLQDFAAGLLAGEIERRVDGPTPHPLPLAQFQPVQDRPMTVLRLFQQLNAFLDDETIVVADPGDALFAGADLFIPGKTRFLAPAYYASLGFAVPAALGAQMADARLRPLVLVGDGAFQMSGLELSTIARFGLDPIVVLLNNRGYGTERPMQDGSFNDVLNWNYSRLPELLGTGRGFEVSTEDQLAAALHEARRHRGSFSLIDVHLEPGDLSPALRRMTDSMGQRVRPAAV
ncbi:alpha-keto acid decarboxylase family protein [Gloeobacter violaceus]|uniref:Alpha-keto-acid decarboxylase n=1 Tax=Gloeobacter violaceus (strain ATCC 29082 / PCC 7421) TaxID=251221 RepID=Q7NIX5_GLOVI|nr:thiamine pyrophosphate-binding protein [Gloeobacter violaceus]BAC89998.1 indole-3-pyruvate decarboxylase [Gloeobacter violaceus PCC 7421]